MFTRQPGSPAESHDFASVALLGDNSSMSRHEQPRVRSFERIGPHVLRVEFADGSTQTIDFTPVLAGELYGPLQDPDVFGQVRLDPEVHNLGEFTHALRAALAAPASREIPDVQNPALRAGLAASVETILDELDAAIARLDRR